MIFKINPEVYLVNFLTDNSVKKSCQRVSPGLFFGHFWHFWKNQKNDPFNTIKDGKSSPKTPKITDFRPPKNEFFDHVQFCQHSRANPKFPKSHPTSTSTPCKTVKSTYKMVTHLRGPTFKSVFMLYNTCQARYWFETWYNVYMYFWFSDT